MFFISLVVCGLIFFGFYKWDGDLLIAIGSALVSLLTLSTSFALSSKDGSRGVVMARVISGIIFMTMMIVNILFAMYDASSTTYIITNGLALCLWAIMFYGIVRSRQ